MATPNQSAAARRLQQSAMAAAQTAPQVADFKQTFGTQGNIAQFSTAGSVAAQDLPKAQFWLNVGYDSGQPQEDGTTRFVSLPQGIALDTMEPVATRSSNSDYVAFQQSRNHLLDQILAKAETLEAGESVIINLQLQLRRVNDEPVDIPSVDNPFIKQLDL